MDSAISMSKLKLPAYENSHTLSARRLFSKHGGVIVASLVFSLLTNALFSNGIFTIGLPLYYHFIPFIPILVLFHFHGYGNSLSISSICNTLLLLIIWILWLSILISPILFLFVVLSLPYKWVIIIVTYFPLLIIAAQNQEDVKKSQLYLFFLTIAWDYPLMIWMYIVSLLNARALGVILT